MGVVKLNYSYSSCYIHISKHTYAQTQAVVLINSCAYHRHDSVQIQRCVTISHQSIEFRNPAIDIRVKSVGFTDFNHSA